MSDRLRNMSNLAQNKAEVSIIIPTYNESENIVQVLKSIGEHIPKDIATEAIVVDDNSPDGTAHKVEELRKIYDPELPVNIYELGLIYDIKVKDEKFAIIKMTLTTPNCPVAESLPKEVKEGAMQVEGIEDVDLELVWDPPWK